MPPPRRCAGSARHSRAATCAQRIYTRGDLPWPCTHDGVALPCTTLTVSSRFASTYLTGRVEAEIAHGVLSELALEGYTTGPLPAPPQQLDPAACMAERRRIIRQADFERDPEKHARLLHSVPTC